jgi:hypothetical protein
MQHLSAVNDKDKGVKSRLRRAFSFGSAAELRRASAENNISAERAKLRKEKYQSEEDAEQAAIIAKQEAAGIGAGIYSGQGGYRVYRQPLYTVGCVIRFHDAPEDGTWNEEGYKVHQGSF